MINWIKQSVNPCLPLLVENANWDGTTLHFHGKEWRFSSMAAWRIIYNNKFISGSGMTHDFKIIARIKNLYIVAIEIQSPDFPIDPVLIFSNGYRLELFSTFYLEPWIFSLPGPIVYAADPTSPIK